MTVDPAPSPVNPLSRSSPRRWFWTIAQWSLFLLVLTFVGGHAWQISQDVDLKRLTIRWGWLALAMLVAVIGWLPCAWYWQRLLSVLGFTPPWRQILRAYYCGHPGKYVPGKGMVLVIRAAMLHGCGVPAAVTVYTVTLETLTYISAGIVTAVLLLPWLLHQAPQWREFADWTDQPAARIGIPILAIAGSVVGLGVLSYVSHRLAAKFQRTIPSMQSMAQGVSIRTISVGLVVFLVAWWMQGVTLGLTLQAISPEPIDWRDWPTWTGAAAVALVVGFLALFAPGGLGVREGLLIELLEQQVGPAQAVITAILWRGVTLAGDVLAAVAMYYLIRPSHPHLVDAPARPVAGDKSQV